METEQTIYFNSFRSLPGTLNDIKKIDVNTHHYFLSSFPPSCPVVSASTQRQKEWASSTL